MELNLEKLNKEQKEAVTFGGGPLLIVAGAGAGKTTVIAQRLAYLVKKELVKPEEILAVTFTEKAAEEMEERVDRVLPYGYIDLWISTFHSFCERVLREYALDIGLPGDFKIVDQTAAWLLVRQNLDKFDLDYYRPLGNPNKFIHSLISHFSRCKDQGIYPENYLKYSESLKTNLTDLPEDRETERIKEVASAYHSYQRLLLENSVLDFGDLINYCLKLFQKRPLILEKYRKKFKYILIDEFQDTNWTQYELIKLLALPENNLTVCADDDQCLPGDAKIEIFQNGKIKKEKIKNIKRGDRILTAVGKGHVGVSGVNKVFKRKKRVKLLTIKTKSGCRITVTDNHKMFCCVPRTHKQKYYYVYLMHRYNLGWRMGVTNDLILRLRLERSADRILAIRAFKAEDEARYHETLWSLKYGIPTSCFKERERIVIKGILLERLYKEINVEKGVQKLAQDLNIELNSHHHCLDAVNRGQSVRIVINLYLCYRKYRSKEHIRKSKTLLLNPWIRHRLTLETSHKEIIKRLHKAGFKLYKAKKGKRVNIESNDLQKLGQLAQKLQKITRGIIESKFYVASKYDRPTSGARNFTALCMPAKNLVLGHYLPVRKGNEIIYDQIVEIKGKDENLIVYDLEVNQTHNFIADGVVIHNSIYKFRGASFSNIVQFKKDFQKAKEVFLVKNYRSTQNILDLAYKFIQNNNPNRLECVSKIDKKLVAGKKGEGVIEHLHFRSLTEESRGVVNKIGELMKKDKSIGFSDFAVLVRANNSASPFVKALERAGFPYQFLASRGLYSKPVILDIISYFKLLDNYHESSAVYRILNSQLWQIPAEDIMRITQYSRQRTKSIYEALEELPLISGLSKETIEKINSILSLIQSHAKLARQNNVSEVLIAFLNDSKYLAALTSKDKSQDIELVNQFYKKIKEFEESALDPTLKNFMEELNLELESGEQGKLDFDPEKGPDMVRIMTIHGAKGLEFKYVFLVSLVDKRFPSIGRKDPIEIPQELVKEIIPEGDLHLQEERRICYVAITRAEKGLFFTSADDYGGTRKKKLSRFLIEMGLEKKSKLAPLKISLAPEKIKREPKLEPVILPGHFSFSQLAAFSKCPLQYKFAHILKVPVKGKATFSFGKTIHNTLYEFVKLTNEEKGTAQENLFGFTKDNINFCKTQSCLSFEDLIGIYKRKWIDEWYEDKNQKEEYYKKGKKVLKDFYGKFKDRPPKILKINNELALELPFNLKLGNYTLKGLIDRIDDLGEGVRIIDYKTGKFKEKLSSEDKLQLLIYQIALEEVFKLKPLELSYYYLEEGQKTSFLAGEKEKQKQKEKILLQIEKIKKSDFSPTPGWQCQYCDFKNICEHSQ
ncbi:UvrD-helicase domain-containing protein [Patescibacteria group bacterium]|nr:UvrD-helicase domain-containing protein [Patescibacteria group bacterium]